MTEVKETLIVGTFLDETDTSKVFNFDLTSATTSTQTTFAVGSTTTQSISFPDNVGTVVGTTLAQSLTGKTIDATLNTLTNIGNASITNLDATKIADGSVTNTEFEFINALGSAAVGVSDAQSLTNKTLTGTTNTVEASALRTNTATPVTVTSSAPSASGKALVTTSTSAATWQNVVTSVSTGVGLSGGPIVTTGTVALADTAVTPGTYGTSSAVSQIIVDQQGRITSATNVTVTGVAPGGAAGGDLTGTYPNPTLTTTGVTAATYGSTTQSAVVAVDAKGRITSASNATINGTTPGGSAGGDLTGTYPNPTLAATAVVAASYGSATQVGTFTVDAKGRLTAASNVTVTGTVPGGSAGGDLTGTYPNPTLTTTGVAAATYGSATQVSQIVVNTKGRITSAANVTVTGTVPGGSAGGDLTGTYPNPTLTTTAVSAGSYTLSSITVDAKGRLTAASSAVIYSQTTVNSFNFTAAERSFFFGSSGVGALSFSGNTLAVGTVIKFKVSGVMISVSDTFTLKIKLGGTTISVSSGSGLLTGFGTNSPFTVDGEMTVVTIGSSGTIAGQAVFTTFNTTLPTAVNMVGTVTSGTTVINTTTSKTFDITGQFGQTGSSIVVTSAVVWKIG